jgi:hypothetical protein
MAVSILLIPILAIVLAVIIGMIVLLINPRTRVIGMVLVGGLFLTPVLFLLWVVPARVVTVHTATNLPPPVESHSVTISPQGQLLPPTQVAEIEEPVAADGEDSLPLAEAPAPADAPAPAPAGAKVDKDPRSSFRHKCLVALVRAIGDALESKDDKTPQKTAASSGKKTNKAAGGKIAVNKPVAKKPVAPKRPAWVGQSPTIQDDIYFTSVKVGPYTTRMECEDNLPEALQAALVDYADHSGITLTRQTGGRIGLPPENLRNLLVKDVWQESVQTSFGPMLQLHARVAINPTTREIIREQDRRTVVFARIQIAAVGLGVVLAFLALLFAWLKAGQATEGRHRWRILTAAIIVVVVAVGMLVA